MVDHLVGLTGDPPLSFEKIKRDMLVLSTHITLPVDHLVDHLVGLTSDPPMREWVRVITSFMN